MRTISGTLSTAQSAAVRTPYIHMVFTSKGGGTTRDLSLDGTYGNRILLLDHAEEAYNDYAVLLLRNNDKALPSLKGFWTEIGYGDTTGTGNEYIGDGSNGGAKATPRLWVKSEQSITAGGRLYRLLELEGMWARLREEPVRIGDPPLYTQNYSAQTAYDILEILLETEMEWTLDALGAQDDSIIDTLTLGFDINLQPFEYMASVIYRLIRCTKCLLRPRAGLNFEVRYPQAGDAVDLTFHSDSAPYFYKLTNRDSVVIPNRIYTYGNAGADGAWSEYVIGDESDTDSINAYAEIADIYLAPDITTEANVELLSAALLSKMKAQTVFGIGTVPHHCAVELLDKLSFIDNRVSQNTYPSDSTVRVGGLRHIYRPGSYTLEVTLGGVSITGDIARSVATQVIVFTDTEEKAITPPVPPVVLKPPAVIGPEPQQPGRIPPRPSISPLETTGTGAAEPEPTRLVPTRPGLWTIGEPETPISRREATTARSRAGLNPPASSLVRLWRTITPWREEAGETFPSWLRSLFR